MAAQPPAAVTRRRWVRRTAVTASTAPAPTVQRTGSGPGVGPGSGIGGSPVIASGQGFFVRTGPLGLGQYSFQLFNRNRVTTFSPANNTFHRSAPDTRPLLTLVGGPWAAPARHAAADGHAHAHVHAVTETDAAPHA